MEYGEIFGEYYSLFRGQASQIPIFGDREFSTAIYLANNAIRKWDRVDGMLWNELQDRAVDQSVDIWATANRTVLEGTIAYPCPTNMRKPPKEVWFFTGTQYNRSPVIDAKELSGLSELSNAVTFLGSANRGYTLYITPTTAAQYAGRSFDYLYYRAPHMLTIATDPSAIKVDMSDPNFMIQDMLVSRNTATRNGFAVKLASSEAKAALINMKIENSSGVPGKSDNWGVAGDWGTNVPINDIRL